MTDVIDDIMNDPRQCVACKQGIIYPMFENSTMKYAGFMICDICGSRFKMSYEKYINLQGAS